MHEPVPASHQDSCPECGRPLRISCVGLFDGRRLVSYEHLDGTTCAQDSPQETLGLFTPASQPGR